jgi:hypothetical protein
MLLPGAGNTGKGLRTVAFRSSEWAVAARLGPPPTLGQGPEAAFAEG